MATSPNRPRQKTHHRRFYKRKGFWLAFLLLLLGTIGIGLVLAERYTRGYRERAATYDLDKINVLEVPSVILDRHGKELGRIFVQNRSIIPVTEVPKRFIDALVAGEDSRFFEHNGVDYMGIVRAVKYNLEGSKQGASTITQQLARGAYNLEAEAEKRGESKIDRKVVEIFLAMRIERRYKKMEILEFYLNRIYFGSGFYGIRSASLGYFGKEPKDLSVAECASMVTLIKNPTGRSPMNNPQANKAGRNYVLGRMVEEGSLKPDEAAAASAEPLTLNPQPLRRGTSHLYERVAEGMVQALGEESLSLGGFKIHTTILKEAQDAAQQALEASLSRAESRPGYAHPKHGDSRPDAKKMPEYLQGAVLMMDHDSGEVLVHIGGRDYAQVPYDFIEYGKRPLGTAFLPFLYAGGLAHGQTPATAVEDEPMDNRAVMIGGLEGIVGEWGMEVPTPVYEGRITVRRALEQSKIAASVRFGNLMGLPQVARTASAFGLGMDKAELLPRICLGWEEVSMKQAVAAYAVFPRGGRNRTGKFIYIDRIEDASGHLVFRRSYPAADPQQVVDEATAWQVHSMMAGSCFRGSSQGVTEGLFERPFPGAGKGGTTHDFADTWFVGYNKRVTCGVWTGFLQANAGAIYPGAFSRDLAMPVWQATMNAIAPMFGGGQIPLPSSAVEVQVCTSSGQRATRFCQESQEDRNTGKIRSVSTAVTEYFRKGTEAVAFCAKHSGGTLMESAPRDPGSLPALSEVPIVPKAPIVIGDDPYHAEVPNSSAASNEASLIRRRTNVLDSLDVTDDAEKVSLPAPGRLQIDEE